MSKKTCNPKDLLEKTVAVSVGDFVTINDPYPIAIYVVKDIADKAYIYGLDITDARDDVVVKGYYTSIESLIKLDDSFVNMNGMLWNIREKILKGEEVQVAN